MLQALRVCSSRPVALGAIPITHLDFRRYQHWRAGPAIFNNTRWANLTGAEALVEILKEQQNQQLLGDNDDIGGGEAPLTYLKVNRNMIFEEYWMEYIEKEAGRSLHWWDRKTGGPATMDEMKKRLKLTATE
jgi:hypothetical protein